eukprot:CAMPEP_0183710790 /NCGR_PEP_ID=MMETSP0737-20130205/6442_1 /TAXON_ID=385413 /ORGANISM="Thalassiosira miniscula, Strain CCMP1093" /LENGTH=46 /DNA_ID= /DNA_START= /DNA_END= /DNA_ORIENTATION=
MMEEERSEITLYRRKGTWSISSTGNTIDDDDDDDEIAGDNEEIKMS